MKNIKKIFVIFILIFLNLNIFSQTVLAWDLKITTTSQESLSNQDKVITMNSLSGDYDSIVNRVKNFGDKEAYSELFYYLKDSNFAERTDTLMIYSKIMAEKHNNENAYIDYLDAITEKYNVKKDLGNYSTIDISKLEPKEKKQITNWLNKMLQNKIISQKEFNEVKK